MSRIRGIGLIVEDDSDFEAFKILIRRIIRNDSIKFRKAVSNGCGRLRRKAASYAANLSQKGCNMIIVVHDLDRNDYNELRKDLLKKNSDSPAKFNFICIPVEEIEAWFLADPESIRRTFSLENSPRVDGLPETISSPKEYIERIVKVYSNKTKLYLNTKHNGKLAENVSIELINDKCRSFRNLNDYLLEQEY